MSTMFSQTISSRRAKVLAHLLIRKRSLSGALLALCLLAVATTNSSLAAEIAFASSSAASTGAASSAAASSAVSSGLANHQQQARAAAASQQMRWAQQEQQQLKSRQQEADQLLEQLLDLEAQPSGSLNECAYWYDLNMRYRELLGNQQATQRPAALHKEAECDNLEQMIAETRDKLTKFKRLLGRENKQLEFVGQLASDYFELNQAALYNEQLARELRDLRVTGVKGRFALEELEQLLLFLRGPEQQEAVGSEVRASLAAPTTGLTGPVDELAEVDSVLRLLIDRELVLNDEELGHLAELGGVLERRLADGSVDVSSGRFRSLSGTLDAVRAIVMHRMAENEEAVQRERELAEIEAELASRRRSVQDRMSNLSSRVANQMGRLSFLASPVGSSVATQAKTNFDMGPTKQLPLSSSTLTGGDGATVAAAGAKAATSSVPNSRSPLTSNGSLQPERTLIGSLRQQRRFADQLAQQQQQQTN